jgi:hypothetical protein
MRLRAGRRFRLFSLDAKGLKKMGIGRLCDWFGSTGRRPLNSSMDTSLVIDGFSEGLVVVRDAISRIGAIVFDVQTLCFFFHPSIP